MNQVTIIQLLNEKSNPLTQWLSCYIILVNVNIIYSSVLLYCINEKRIVALCQFYNTIKILEHLINILGTFIALVVETKEINTLETTIFQIIISLKWILIAI